MSRGRWLSLFSYCLLTTEAALGRVIVEEFPQTQSQSAPRLLAQGATKGDQPYQTQSVENEQFLSCRRVRQVTHVLGDKIVTHPTDFVRCTPLPNLAH